MSKTKKINLIFALFAAFFAFLFGALSFGQIANAATFGNETVNLLLVGKDGYSPKSYFDSQSQSKIASPDKDYYDRNNKLTDDYYVVKSDTTHLTGAYSTGNLSFDPFGDYLTLANKNVLYVSASTGIVADSLDVKNKVKISLTHNGQTKTATNSQKGSSSSNYYTPFYYQTASIKVDGSSAIRFSYTSGAKASWFSKSKFKLFMPSLNFETRITSVSFENTNSTVYHNDIVKLEASNKILDIDGSGDLLSYYKTKHQIEYEIIQGAEYASVIGNYLYFTGDESGVVRIRPKALKNSNSNEYVYGNTVIYNYNAEKKNILPEENFAGSAQISGEGQYYVDDTITLIANMNENFNFEYWEVNGEKIYTRRIYYKVKNSVNQIKLFSKRDLVISEIIIEDKYYDGTKTAPIKEIVMQGVLPEHDARLEPLEAVYFTSSAGTKIAELTSLPNFVGEDIEWYNFSSFVPVINGKILPKQIEVIVEETQKTYGESDPEFTYQTQEIIEGDDLQLSAQREEGEDVGQYLITFTANNANYETQIEDSYLTIVKRELTFENFAPSKTFDNQFEITINPNLIGIQYNDDITCQIIANFQTKEVGQDIEILYESFGLDGDKKDNYSLTLENLPSLFGEIFPKEASITIEASNKIYGDDDPDFRFKILGEIESAPIGGNIQREQGENAGEYDLTYENASSNYSLSIISATFTINKKDASIIADNPEKVYGEEDPEFLFDVEGLVFEDEIQGVLQREEGEDVGNYKINIGTISDPNYDFSFVSNYLTIIQRELEGTLSFDNKVYDGTNSIGAYSYNFTNLFSSDSVTLTIEAELADVNAAEYVDVNITDYSISDDNYLYIPQSYTAQILPRPVSIHVDSMTKTYGEEDSQILYTYQNVVSGETLIGELTRVSGESVSSYQIELGTLNQENNPNYQISLDESATYTILKRTIKIQTISQSKQYNNADPEFEFEFLDNTHLVFEDAFEDVVGGSPQRQEGESPGIYSFQQGNIYSNSNNYNVVFVANGNLTILKAEITVTANSATKIYGDSDPTFTYNTNLQTTDEFDFRLQRQIGEGVGTYQIGYLTLYSEFYNIDFVPATLTVIPRNLSLKADDKIKIYGQDDPTFTFSITSGILVYGDLLQDIVSGDLSREVGEEVGDYQIVMGQFEVSQNYSVNFTSGNLSVQTKNIIVTAQPLSKEYMQPDPELTYDITLGEMSFDDVLTGSLQREAGEVLGEYQVEIGTLEANSNYSLSFESNTFIIERANITITANQITKQYGDEDPQIIYQISGNYHSGDVLDGELTREVGEDVGEYNFVSTLSNSNYIIQNVFETFVIQKRVIKIIANSYTINYGEQIPNLGYTMEGSIVEGDTLVGEIYKVAGDDAGVYDVSSTFNLGRNYDIQFTKGTFTILALDLSVNVVNATKIYGNSDAVIEYEIVSGSLINDDVLTGYITREVGEDVGNYQVYPSFTNSNYIVTIQEGVYSITPKEITIYATVEDKIYDGGTKATLSQMIIIGLIDSGISLDYDSEDYADFVSSDVGSDIDVVLHDITLSGEKAFNYSLQLPILKGNITFDTISSGFTSINAIESAELSEDISLEVENSTSTTFMADDNKVVLKQLDIQLTQNGEEVALEDDVEVSVNLENVNYQNVNVYLLDEAGNYTLLHSSYKNGVLTFETDNLGQVVIVADSLNWLDYSAVFGLILIIGMTAAYVYGKKKKQTK